MKFLVDAHLSQKLCVLLVARGHDAVHVSAMPLGFDTPDSEITAMADDEGRVVVSKDGDFVNTQAVSGKPARLLRIRVGNSTNKALFALIDRFLDDIVTGFGEADRIELHETMLIVHSRS